MLPMEIRRVETQLKELDVEEKTIRQIVEILEESAGNLRTGELGTFNTARLGGSWRGAELGLHTTKAHGHVVKAMQDMALGLRGYQVNVQKFHKEIDFVDQDSHASQTRITGKVNDVVPTISQAEDCAAPEDFSNDNQCTIPSDGDN